MSEIKVNGQLMARSLAGDYDPGSYWTHFKGGVYQLISLAVQEDTGEVMVVYKSLKHGTTWIRTLDNFSGNVATSEGWCKRFVKGAP